MKKSEWFKLYDESYPKFKWFIEQYFPSIINTLGDLRKKENIFKLIDMLNIIWFELPDNKFNIRENPDGWNEFIELLENQIFDKD